MPRIGTPSSYTPWSMVGAPSWWTDLGPPEKMRPAGLRSASSAAMIVCGTISEYTWHSRTRRAISWAYWAPKSMTSTVSGLSVEGLSVGGIASVMSARRHHEIGLLEL